MHIVPVMPDFNQQKRMTAVIILNWNGADDTIMCLDSLSHADGSFFIVIADNGSTDNSVQRLKSYISQSGLDITLLEHNNNFGFAKGNNLAISYASKRRPDSYLLLNNDTEVTSDFLVKLVDFQSSNPRFRILTPRINFFYKKNIIWNCGGVLRLGFRKYRFAGCEEKKATRRKYFPISFITGCALFFMPDVLEPDGTLFTERFFFGEEDFEFSIRMKRRHYKMACVTDSVIYHKVMASSEGKSVGKFYLHLLNRYVDVRLQYGKLFFFIWRIVNKPISFCHLKKIYGSAGQALQKLRHLEKDCLCRDKVTYEDFRRLVISDDFFDESND